MDKIKVMIIDEQVFFRAGVRQALSPQSDLEISDCDPNEDPLGLVEANPPDIALLGADLAAPGGLALGRKIARHYPNTKVIMLSPATNDEELFTLISTAAVTCLSKQATAEDLAAAIRRAYNGQSPINESPITRPVVARQVLTDFHDGRSTGKAMEAAAGPLTYREIQILDYIAAGNSNKQIARILGISEQTIKNHVSAILGKLHANDRAHAVALAIRQRWLSAENKL